jgi:hypothetical protein
MEKATPKMGELLPLFVAAAKVLRKTAHCEKNVGTFSHFSRGWAPNGDFANAELEARYQRSVKRLDLWLGRDLHAFQTRIDKAHRRERM